MKLSHCYITTTDATVTGVKSMNTVDGRHFVNPAGTSFLSTELEIALNNRNKYYDFVFPGDIVARYCTSAEHLYPIFAASYDHAPDIASLPIVQQHPELQEYGRTSLTLLSLDLTPHVGTHVAHIPTWWKLRNAVLCHWIRK